MKTPIIQPSKELLAIEAVFDQHEKGFFAMASGLIQVRDKKLYKFAYDTFEEYCELRRGWTRQYVYQCIKGALVIKHLQDKMSAAADKILLPPNTLGDEKPENLSQRAARELANVPEPDQLSVYTDAAKNGKVTAPAVKRAAGQRMKSMTGIQADAYTSGVAPEPDEPETEESKPAPEPEKVKEPEIVRDETGCPVPENLMGYWNRTDEVQALLTMLSKVKSAIKKAQDDCDLMFVEVNFTGVIADIEHAYGSIKRAKPYAVCSSCQGKAAKSCTLCGGKGLVSEMKWGVVPRETKELRNKLRK